MIPASLGTSDDCLDRVSDLRRYQQACTVHDRSYSLLEWLNSSGILIVRIPRGFLDCWILIDEINTVLNLFAEIGTLANNVVRDSSIPLESTSMLGDDGGEFIAQRGGRVFLRRRGVPSGESVKKRKRHDGFHEKCVR